MMNEEQKARLDKSLNDISRLCIAIPKTDVYEREYDDGFSHARMISSDVLQDIKNGVKSKGAVKAYEMTAGADFNKDYFYYNISKEYVSKVKEACENIPADKLNDGLQFVESAVESAKIGHAVDNALFNDDLMNSVAANKYGLDFTDLKFSTDDLRAEVQSKSADVKNPILNQSDLSKDQLFEKDAVIEETKSSDRIYGTGKRGDEFADFDNNIQTEQSMSY